MNGGVEATGTGEKKWDSPQVLEVPAAGEIVDYVGKLKRDLGSFRRSCLLKVTVCGSVMRTKLTDTSRPLPAAPRLPERAGCHGAPNFTLESCNNGGGEVVGGEVGGVFLKEKFKYFFLSK